MKYNKLIIVQILIVAITLVAFACNKPKGASQVEEQKSNDVKTETKAEPVKEEAVVEEEEMKIAKSFSAPLTMEFMVAEGEQAPSESLVKLGKSLYFDPRLSKSNAFSCNSCHNLASFGVDNRSFSIGHDFKQGGRNAPTVLNAGLHIAQFWDGRAEDLEAQAEGPVLNPVEMASPDEKFVVDRLKSVNGYQSLFKAAYPTDDEPITYKNMAKAIGAFERSLVTPSPFDKYMQGDATALTQKQKEGLKTFNSVGCTQCHNGIAVGGSSYRKFGVVNPVEGLKDRGRVEITKNADDEFVFKVPSLRNIEGTYPYFHDGSVWTLEEAVSKMAFHQLGKELTADELAAIVEFLKSLTGEIPKSALELPLLPVSGSETSHPEP